MSTSAIIGIIICVTIAYGYITILIGAEIEKALDKGSFCFFIPSVWRGTKIFN